MSWLVAKSTRDRKDTNKQAQRGSRRSRRRIDRKTSHAMCRSLTMRKISRWSVIAGMGSLWLLWFKQADADSSDGLNTFTVFTGMRGRRSGSACAS